jgi:hypothetical protein
MIFCARATRGLRRVGRVAWPSSCSRNAHDKNVLVRRAQSRIDQATLENEMGNWECCAQWKINQPPPPHYPTHTTMDQTGHEKYSFFPDLRPRLAASPSPRHEGNVGQAPSPCFSPIVALGYHMDV